MSRHARRGAVQLWLPTVRQTPNPRPVAAPRGRLYAVPATCAWCGVQLALGGPIDPATFERLRMAEMRRLQPNSHTLDGDGDPCCVRCWLLANAATGATAEPPGPAIDTAETPSGARRIVAALEAERPDDWAELRSGGADDNETEPGER